MYDMMFNVSAFCAVVFCTCYIAVLLTPHDRVRHWEAQTLLGICGIIGSAWPVLHLMGFADITAGRVLVASVATLFLVITANQRLMYAVELRRSRLVS